MLQRQEGAEVGVCVWRGRWSNHPIGQTSSCRPGVCMLHANTKYPNTNCLPHCPQQRALPLQRLRTPSSCISSQVSRSGRSSLSALGERGSCGCSICLPSPLPSSLFPLPAPTLHAFAVSFYASNSNSLGLWLTLSCFAVYRVATPSPPPAASPKSRQRVRESCIIFFVG